MAENRESSSRFASGFLALFDSDSRISLAAVVAFTFGSFRRSPILLFRSSSSFSSTFLLRYVSYANGSLIALALL